MTFLQPRTKETEQLWTVPVETKRVPDRGARRVQGGRAGGVQDGVVIREGVGAADGAEGDEASSVLPIQ